MKDHEDFPARRGELMVELLDDLLGHWPDDEKRATWSYADARGTLSVTVYRRRPDEDEERRPDPDWMDKEVVDWQALSAEHPDWTDAQVSAAYRKGERAASG